jgi:ABC-type dipeptide/oligopeptide/nickel transport system permease subunit
VTARVLSAGWLQVGDRRELRRCARLFVRSASSLAGLAIVAAFLVLTAIGPWIVPYPEDARGAVHLERKLQPPSGAHWFGTDEVGNDVYTRVILGARVSLACRSASWPATSGAPSASSSCARPTSFSRCRR